MPQVNQPCPGILQCTFVYDIDNQRVENVIHVDKHANLSWPQADIDALLASLATVWDTYFKPLLPSTAILLEIIGTDLINLTGLRRVYAMPVNTHGTNIGQPLALSVTKAFNLFTGSRGRGVNGKFYWPQLTEDNVGGDTVDSTFLGFAEAAIVAIDTAVQALSASNKLSVLSRTLGGVKRAAGIGRDVLSVGCPNSTVDVMKDRLPAHNRKRKKHTP